MEPLLNELGFNKSETNVYLHLLEHNAVTAAIVSKAVHQTRTNTYMVLKRLMDERIVLADDSASVRKFKAANPRVLQQQLRARQQTLARTGKSLDLAMPDLLSAYNLAQQRPGIIYLEGYDGLRISFEDQAKSKTELLVWGSDVANEDPKIWQLIEKGGYKRRALGIKTRALFQEAATSWPHISDFALKGFDVRFWGCEPVNGEVLIYDNRVTFTTYAPEIMVTVLTNDVIADTFRAIFEQCWRAARKI